MIATILDTVTGKKMTITGIHSFEWADGNWSCDCNRNPFGADTGKSNDVCQGQERFLIVEAVMDPNDYEYTLDELNAMFGHDRTADEVQEKLWIGN